MDSIEAAETLTSGLLPPEDIYSQSSDLQALAPNQNSPSEPELPNPNIPAPEPESHSPIDKQALAPKEPNQTAPSQSTGEDETNGRRRRRSRWDSSADTDGDNRKKRISRWSNDEPKPVFQLPEFMKEYMQGMNPEIQPLQARLDEIHRILQSGSQLDDRPEGARSPSPEPVYDNLGIRINTREYRARERLNRERQEIIAQIMKRDPGYKPPADYKPPKLYKKLYIPMKEYPGYNFIGLIIGPRGNTQKRMEKETGAKIVIRGKGSIKEGRFGQKRDVKFDPAENEDLHVLVEADNQEALDAAAGMVEKLLRPVDEGLNEHKRQQLRELATLNGTIKDEELCRLCGETGHRQYACPSRMSTFKSDVKCSNCGDGGHPTSDCPVKEGGTGKQMEDAYWSFMAEVNGTNPESLTKQSMPLAIMGSNGSGSNPPWASNNNAGSTGSALHPGLGSSVAKIGKEIDDSNLYIGSLPPTFDDNELIRLFQPFGDIVTAKVVKDKITGACKGYGFVKYSDVAQANQAITNMNGYRLDGKVIAVRVAGKPPQPFIPPGPPATPFPAYRSPNQGFGGYPSQQMQSSGAPPGSYTGAPLPWGAPPPPPPPYAAYPLPPPPGSSAYASFQGQPMPPYGVPPYPTMTQSPSPQNVPSGETQPSYSAASNNIYGMAQPYTTDSMGYASYYYVNPPPPPAVPQSSVEQQQSFSSAPWGANPPMPPPPPPPPVEQIQQTTYDAEGDYEKLMAELK